MVVDRATETQGQRKHRGRGIMVAFHASALDGVARNPVLPTPLLLRLLAFDGGGDGPPRQALHRAGLPEPAVAVILTTLPPRCVPLSRTDPSGMIRGRRSHRFMASLATHRDPAARRSATRAWEILAPGERSALLADPDPEVWRAAALWECRRDAHVTAELLRDPKSVAEALRCGLLVRSDAERCVAERTHLAALAEDPSLPADLVERLAVDPTRPYGSPSPSGPSWKRRSRGSAPRAVR